MSVFPQHPAWDFVTRLYGRPDVAPACLALQDRHDVDVTLMLFCLWRGVACGGMPLSAMTALAAAAGAWRAATVSPLRAARRWLKQKEDAAGLYKIVLSAEIDCEHGELLMLAALADSLCRELDRPPPADAMAANLDILFHVWKLEPDERDRAAVTTILDAAAAETAHGRPQAPHT
jgi:uncharacterized protein (TIGR02444 family)